MDLKQLVKEEKVVKKELNNEDNDGNHQTGTEREKKTEMETDFCSALQSFLNHIPITPILSSDTISSVVELKSDVYCKDAISLLYSKSASGAPIVDNVDSELPKFVDRDIGFIEFSSIVLWSLEEFEKVRTEPRSDSGGFLSMLEKNPQIGQTKIGELAKSFLWEPFFPINSADTLFHVLLLFAKHPRLNTVPVVKSSNSSVVSFINQNAVVQLLLQSNGLKWFDQIADKTIEQFGFEKSSEVFCVYEDQSVADALHVLWEKQTDGVPVVNRGNETLVGVIRGCDIHLLLEDDNLFKSRKRLTVEEFIENYAKSDQKTKGSCRSHLSTPGFLLNNNLHPQMNSFATNHKSDSIKQAMKSLVESNSAQSFLVNESGKLEGVLTLREIISQFSPPSMDSRIDGGSFFQAALQQAGCHVKDGSLISNQ